MGVAATQFVIVLPFVALAALSINLLVVWALSCYVRGNNEPSCPSPREEDLPPVLVQLPLYNEPRVVERLLLAVAALDWPRDRLRIQVLDDSTDETANIAEMLVCALRLQAVDILHLRRVHRDGFKAGALASGLAIDDSPFIAIFDADFIPPRDFLRRAVPPLLNDERLGFTQARWEHTNGLENHLTVAQAMMIDAHFMVEQRARSKTRLLLQFNGTCGVWRRAAIESAGGWAGDTLCEDFDLSIRARLAGWSGLLIEDLTVPGEIPASPSAWQAQQFRWMKGFMQVGRKMLPKVWCSELPFVTKLGLTLHIGQSLCYPLMFLVLVETSLLLVSGTKGLESVALFGGSATIFGIGSSVLCLATGSIVLNRRSQSQFVSALTVTILLNAGLMLSNTCAMVEGLTGSTNNFVRTPKRGSHGGATCSE